MRLFLAFKVFWRTLTSGQYAQSIAQLNASSALPKVEEKPMLDGPAANAKPAKPAQPAETKPAPVKPAGRSDALTLLATLQREARFLDFLQESLAGLDDASIGAAVREVHRDCGKVIERMFGIVPLAAQAEGTPLEVPTGFDAQQYRVVGNVVGQPPYRGTLAHQGWKATRCDVPVWTGGPSAGMTLAPAEVDVR